MTIMQRSIGVVIVLGMSASVLLSQETATPEISLPTETPILTATDVPIPTIEPTQTPVEMTATQLVLEPATPMPTETTTVTPEIIATLQVLTSTPTPTATLEMSLLTGTVAYQNRVGGLEDVRIVVYDAAAQVVAVGQVLTDGNWLVTVPLTERYVVAISAPLHLVSYITSDTPLLTTIVLAGGDLDSSGCVDNADLALLTAFYGMAEPSGDITDDGIVNASDLAILSGNLQLVCLPQDPFAQVTPTADVSATPPADITMTPETTATPAETDLPTAEPSSTAVPLPTIIANPDTPTETTEAPTAEATEAPTAEATEAPTVEGGA